MLNLQLKIMVIQKIFSDSLILSMKKLLLQIIYYYVTNYYKKQITNFYYITYDKISSRFRNNNQKFKNLETIEI